MFKKFKTLKSELDVNTQNEIKREVERMSNEGRMPIKIDYDIYNNKFKVWYK